MSRRPLVAASLSMAFPALLASCAGSKAPVAASPPAAAATAPVPAATPATPSSPSAPEVAPMPASPASPLDYTVDSLQGKPVHLADYRGKTVLIVNTASECGFTPQYAGLEKLYETYQARGLVVIGFPSNDYGAQEPGGPEEIATFCKKNYGVTFPMMAKVHTKGPEKAPIYKTLTEETPEGIRGEVKWNFTKFLIDPTGKVVARFDSKIEPTSPPVIEAVEKALPAK